tara:strand:+ start:2792 stop:3448 length:657 start_codon:yes stop_codon:yes gene_type:complete
MSLKLKIKNNLDQIKNMLPVTCGLIAVSKYVTSNEIRIAYECGQRDFGENRVPDLINKSKELCDTCPDIRWHMIGNLQSNKIKNLLNVKNLYAVHSLYEKKHLEIFNKNLSSPLRVYFQVNSSKESQKGGVESYSSLIELINMINNECLIFAGLMGMGKLDSSTDELYQSFCDLKQVCMKLETSFNKKLKVSMGMSSDFELALKAGSNYVRIGSAIFK